MQLRKWVDELVIYSGDDLSKNEAEELKQSSIGGWSLDIEPADSIPDVNRALMRYVNLRRVTFCTHGFSGGVFFENGSMITVNLTKLDIPRDLYHREGQLLFLGCETARNQEGENFLIAAGRRFFAGKGGVVGGTTVNNIAWPVFGTVLPYLSFSWDRPLPESGKLILYRLDTQGNVVARNATR